MVVVVRCPAEPIQQEEKGCRVRIGRLVSPSKAWDATYIQLMMTPKTMDFRAVQAEDTQGVQSTPIQVPPTDPRPPKPCLAHLTQGGEAKKCCLDQLAIFEDIDLVLTEGSAPRHVHNGHTVL